MKFHRNKSKLHVHTRKGKKYVTCFVRQQTYLLTPEEEIRQMLLYHFIYEMNIPVERILVEKKLTQIFPDIQHPGRLDILVLNDKPKGNLTYRDLNIIVECKRPKGNIGQAYDQIFDYNKELGANYMVITDGKESYIFFISPQKRRIELLSDLPSYADVLKCKSGGLEIAYLADEDIINY